MGFEDWREAETQNKYKGGSPRTVAPEVDRVDWWNPTTWGNSYLFSEREPYVAPLDKDEQAQAYKDEGKYFYTRDLSGGGSVELTPIQRHAEWLQRDTTQREDMMFGYDTDAVLESAAANEGLDITVFRDAILLGAAETYFNSQFDERIQYETPIGPPGPNSIEAFNFFNDPANRSGSGSGSRGPQYVGPDRRVVEEYVGDKMIVLTGKRQPELNKFVDAYLKDAKAQFEGASIDPAAGVLERIRGTAEYKRIHTLRNEATDENTWVNRRQQRLEQLGVTSADSGQRGIELAATGANLNDISTGKLQASRGRKDITLMNRLEGVAEQIGGLI